MNKAEYSRQWRKDNPDKVRKYERDRYARSEKLRAYRKSYYADYRRKNIEDLKAKSKARYESDKQPYFDRAWKRIHTMRALRNGGKSDYYTKDQVCEKYGGLCIVCDKYIDRLLKYPHPYSLTIHHLMPISKGGDDTFENVAPAHSKCNLGVGNRVPIAVRPLLLNV